MHPITATDPASGRTGPSGPALVAACVVLAIASVQARAAEAPPRPAPTGAAGLELERALADTTLAVSDAPASPDAASPASPGEAVLTVLDADAQFGRGGAALAAEARVMIERLARRLDALERVLSVRVIGHADSVGDAQDNLALSERRARFVADLFSARWPGVHTLAVGAGESAPVADNATEAGRAANRRVEVQVIGIARPSPPPPIPPPDESPADADP